MSTNRDEYCTFFNGKHTTYCRNIYSWTLLGLLLIAGIIRNKNQGTPILIVLLLCLTVGILNIIANIVRVVDINKLMKYESIKETTITVNKNDNWEINKTYSIIYPKSKKYSFELGKRYTIKYLYGTMGRYIVEWKLVEDK